MCAGVTSGLAAAVAAAEGGGGGRSLRGEQSTLLVVIVDVSGVRERGKPIVALCNCSQ